MKLAKTYDVSQCVDIAQVLSVSGTGWEPDVKPISAIGDTDVNNGGYMAIYRPDTNTVLGCVTGRYKPDSHVFHVAKLDTMVRNGDLVPENVSVWDNGRIIAYQFRAPVLDAAIVDGDKVSPLLTLAFYHDGKGGDMSFFADFRWFCKNQMGKVADASEGKKAYHRGNVVENYSELMQGKIDSLRKSLTGRYDTMRHMAHTGLGGKSLLAYFGHSLGLPDVDTAVNELWSKPEEAKGHAKTIRNVLGMYREDDCQSPGTVWQAYNAVTRYVTHGQGRNPATRSARALLGTGQAIINNAFREAARLAA